LYRGAAPIQWAIARGETVTGVTSMRIDEGLDTGDILLQRELPVPADATSEEMYPALAELGALVMVETLSGLTAGTIVPRKQDDAQSSLAPLLTRDDARVDFTQPAAVIYNRWRGFQPWPGAYAFIEGKKLTLHRMRPISIAEKSRPGEMVVKDGVFIGCGDGWLELTEVQLEGKKRMPVQDFLRGAGLKSGTVLS
jgi:methionyl-tRNA formyltransferase